MQKKGSEIFGKTHRKTPVRSLYLACRHETFLKKRLLRRCFPMIFFCNSSEHLFHRTPENSLTTLTIIFNFVENIWNFGAWSNLKTYLEHIAWESCFPKIFFYKWIEFSKSFHWVWNDRGICLRLILFPSSLRKMSWRKQKYAQ